MYKKKSNCVIIANRTDWRCFMEKYDALITIINNNEKSKYNAEVHEDIERQSLFYIEKDKTTTTYNYKDNILKRDNDKINLEFTFNLNELTKNSITIKELNNTMEVDIITKEITHTDKILKIVYEMNDSLFTYIIEKE